MGWICKCWYVFSNIGLLLILLSVTTVFLRAFKGKATSNSINNTNSENESVNVHRTIHKNFDIVGNYIKVEKINRNIQVQKKKRHKNIKRSIEGQKEKQDYEYKKDADKKFEEFAENLLKYDSKNIKDYKDIKDLECEFVSTF